MRLLYLSFNRTGQGTYWRAYHLGRHLARRGHEITLIATSPKRKLGISRTCVEGIQLIEMPDLLSGSLRSGWDPWNTLNRIAWLSRQKFDLVHSFEARPTVIYPARMVARKNQIPLVIDWCDWFGRGGSVEERTNPFVRWVLRPVETYFEEHFRPLADANTVICTTLREKAHALHIPPERLLLLYNGSDIEGLHPIPIRDARQQTNLPEGVFIIGYVGTIFPKDAEMMAQAFDQIHNVVPEARLLITGHCPVDLRSLVRQPEAVITTGYVETRTLNTYLAASDVFWLPLRDTNANRGRFPLKLTDYLAVGRPVVATAVGEVGVVMDAEPVGLLSPPDPTQFAEQTIRLYRDPSLRDSLGRQARQLAETRFNWANLVEPLEKFYLALSYNRMHASSGENH